jgi:hypothetical protein
MRMRSFARSQAIRSSAVSRSSTYWNAVACSSES